MFAGVMSRVIPATALTTAVPRIEDRGAFMSINSSLQQIAGGVASVIAGWVIIQQPGGRLLHFDTLGYMCIGLMVACGVCMYVINGQILTMVHIKQVNKENKIELVA